MEGFLMSNENLPKTKNNLFPWIIVAILIISSVISFYFVIKFRGDYLASEKELETSYFIIEEKDSNISNLENQLDLVEKINSNNNQLISEQANLIVEKDNLISIQEDEISTLTKDKRNIQNSLNETSRKLNKLICDENLNNMDYKDILTSSDRLAAFMSGLPDVERTSFTLRNTLWNNALSKVHVITYLSKEDGNVYSMQFLVYYDEFGLTPSTFWIDEQCWLDAP